MTALSWIFGGKKKEDKPVPVTVEAIEIGTDEDYTLVQASGNQMGIYPQVPSNPYPSSQFYTPLPYPMLPQRQNQQPTGTEASVRTNITNQLEGVPFVLSPSLSESFGENQVKGLEDLRRAVFQIAADINDSTFDYDFKLERSIKREASLYNHDN